MNVLLTLKEKNQLPEHVVTFSSGNHAQGVARAAQLLGIKATIVMPDYVSSIKRQAAEKYYGATVIATKTRPEAEAKTQEVAQSGAYYIHPFADDDLILGQGTAVYEALQEMKHQPDAIFTACGGGGLLSGSFLAKSLLSPTSKIYGVEPLEANDVATSYKQGSILRFEDSPQTIADGVRTLSTEPTNFHYLQQTDGFFEIEEQDIIYWTQWLTHLLRLSIEPTAALAMAGAYEWLKTQSSPQQILVVLSGGNLDHKTRQIIWQEDKLKDMITQK